MSAARGLLSPARMNERQRGGAGRLAQTPRFRRRAERKASGSITCFLDFFKLNIQFKKTTQLCVTEVIVGISDKPGDRCSNLS